MSAQAIEALLHEARRARAQSDLAAAERHLAQAAALDGPGELRARVRWKWAKVLADLDATERALTALQADLPLFEGYPQAFRGARRLARLHQERVGYAHPALPWLWTQLLEATRAAHPSEAVELVLLDRAWCHACRGEREAMESDLDRVNEREDAANYTRLCAANWALDAERARDAAVDLAPTTLHTETALFEAHLRFGLPAPAPTNATPYLQALARGHGFSGLPEILRAQGPEFALAAHQSAVLAGELTPPTDRWGCEVFRFQPPSPRLQSSAIPDER